MYDYDDHCEWFLLQIMYEHLMSETILLLYESTLARKLNCPSYFSEEVLD